MCEYCGDIEPGKVCKTYYDDGTSYCELAWFPGDKMPTLQVKSDGNWACVMIMHCPICGRELGGDAG